MAEASAGKAIFEPAFSDQLDLGSPALDAISAGWFLADLASPPEQVQPPVALAPASPSGRFVVTDPVEPVRAIDVDAARGPDGCTRGWVELHVGDHVTRRLLRELPARGWWTFPVPDLALTAGTPLELTGTHCPVAVRDGGARARRATPDSDVVLVATDGWQAYRRPSARPRLELATRTEVVRDADERLRRLQEREDDTLLLSSGQGGRYEGGRASFVADTPDRVEVAVTSDGPGLLVLRDVDAPGWHAAVDGVATPIQRVDHAFRGVEVPDGTSSVTFTYAPASLRRGAWLALAGLGVLTALAAWQVYSSRSRRNLPV